MKKITIFSLLFLLAVTNVSGKVNSTALPLFDKAYQLMEEGQIYEAIPYYKLAIKADPECQDIWMEYTSCLRKAKYLERAARAGWRALELGPPTKAIWNNLGNVFSEAREWDTAMDAFKNAAILSSNKRWSSQNFLVLGYSQMISGDSASALKTFQHGLRVDPTYGMAEIDIGVAKATMGRIEEGVQDIQQGMTLAKEEAKKTSEQSKGVRYGESVLAKIEKDGKILMADSFSRESFQRLPKRFLEKPSKGTALHLKIDPVIERLYQISPMAMVSLTLPEEWRESIEKSGLSDVALYIKAFVYRPEKGDDFMLLFTPNVAEKKIDDLKTVVEEYGHVVLEKSIEKKLELVTIKTPFSEGYAFTVSDKELSGKTHQGEDYPFMTQGLIESGGSFCTITVISDSNDEKFLKKIYDIMTSFRYMSSRQK